MFVIDKIFNLKIDTKNKNITTVTGLKQFDNNSVLNITLLQNSLALDLSNCTIRINFLREDDKVLLYMANIVNAPEGKVSIKLSPEVLEKSGLVKADISVFDSNLLKITSATFNLRVEKSIYNDTYFTNKDLDLMQQEYIREKERQANETNRVQAENTRNSNENTRISNEEARKKAEDTRVAEWNDVKKDANNIKNTLDTTIDTANKSNTDLKNNIDTADKLKQELNINTYVTHAKYSEFEKKTNSQYEDLANKSKKQRDLTALFYKKIMRKEDVIVVCQGDSLTYGQDTASSDKVEASGKTDNGVSHSFTRAKITYPTALQEYLREIYNNNSVVINKGFSGDWVDASIKHWNINSNADVVFIMLGTNDGNLGASWIPENVKGNISKYMESMRKLIEQYTKWNTAVILLSPPRLKNQENPETTTSNNTEPYRLALQLLAEEYGCTYVNAEDFLNGCNDTYYSDSTHLNSKGYKYFASRLVSVLIGYGVENKVSLGAGNTLSVRSTRDNFVNNGCVIGTDPNSLGAEEGSPQSGLLAIMQSGNSLYYSFETEEDNLILIPIFSKSECAISTTILDFGNEQGSIPLLSATESYEKQGIKPLSTITSSEKTNNTNSYDGTINTSTPNRYLHITNKGWHNIKYTNTGNGSIYFNGFVIMSFKEFSTQGKIKEIQNNTLDTTPTKYSEKTMDYKINGMFIVLSSDASTIKNAPFTTVFFFREFGDGDYFVQIAFSTTLNQIKIRYLYGTTWSSWLTVTTTQ